MLLSAISLWFKVWLAQSKVLAALCAGACLFLGYVELSYGLSSGLYQIKHAYVDAVMESAISVLLIGIVSLIILISLASKTS